MYEPIFLAQVRRARTITIPAGGWIILGGPDQPLSVSIEQRAKLIKNGNVNDDYSAVLIGRIQDTNTPVKFQTAEEAKKAKELEKAHQDSLTRQHADAKQLRVQAEKEEAKRKTADHTARLQELNAENDAIRNRGGSPAPASETEPTAAIVPETAPVLANEFKLEDLNAKDQGTLLKLADELVKAGRITAPAKTSKGALIEAILAAPAIDSQPSTQNP